MNQKLPDSGIPIRFNPLGYRSSECDLGSSVRGLQIAPRFDSRAPGLER
jgi:hypothetical protein